MILRQIFFVFIVVSLAWAQHLPATNNVYQHQQQHQYPHQHQQQIPLQQQQQYLPQQDPYATQQFPLPHPQHQIIPQMQQHQQFPQYQQPYMPQTPPLNQQQLPQQQFFPQQQQQQPFVNQSPKPQVTFVIRNSPALGTYMDGIRWSLDTNYWIAVGATKHSQSPAGDTWVTRSMSMFPKATIQSILIRFWVQDLSGRVHWTSCTSGKYAGPQGSCLLPVQYQRQQMQQPPPLLQQPQQQQMQQQNFGDLQYSFAVDLEAESLPEIRPVHLTSRVKISPVQSNNSTSTGSISFVTVSFSRDLDFLTARATKAAVEFRIKNETASATQGGFTWVSVEAQRKRASIETIDHVRYGLWKLRRASIPVASSAALFGQTGVHFRIAATNEDNGKTAYFTCDNGDEGCIIPWKRVSQGKLRYRTTTIATTQSNVSEEDQIEEEEEEEEDEEEEGEEVEIISSQASFD